jgi:hypothetical protein
MLLCFLGVRSRTLAAACAGFGLGSGFATALRGGALVAFLVGAGVLVRLAIGAGAFAVGAMAGGVVAASAYRTLPPTVVWPAAPVVLVVAAAALLCGAAVHHLRGPLLRVVCALAGAALVVRGAVQAGPAFRGFLRHLGREPGGAGRVARARPGRSHRAARGRRHPVPLRCAADPRRGGISSPPGDVTPHGSGRERGARPRSGTTREQRSPARHGVAPRACPHAGRSPPPPPRPSAPLAYRPALGPGGPCGPC